MARRLPSTDPERRHYISRPSAADLGLNFHAYLNSEYSLKHCRRRKARTVFSDHQLNGLEKRFDGQKYLSTPERVELANALNLSEAQVSDRRLHHTVPTASSPFRRASPGQNMVRCRSSPIHIRTRTTFTSRFQNRRMKHKKQVRRQLQNTTGGSPLSDEEDECFEENEIDVVSSDECSSNNSSSK